MQCTAPQRRDFATCIETMPANLRKDRESASFIETEHSSQSDGTYAMHMPS
jgi:hypothetical protein